MERILCFIVLIILSGKLILNEHTDSIFRIVVILMLIIGSMRIWNSNNCDE